MSTYSLYLGDCVPIMRGMEAESIDLTVTSPPYDNLRTYKGYVFDFENTAKELYRLTKPGGVVVWVVADQTIGGSETGTSFRHALYFKDLGFNLYDTMVYEVAGTGAKGSHRAYWQAFEYMFVLSKGMPQTTNLISDRKNIKAGIWEGTSPKADIVGSRQKNGGYFTPMVGKRTNIWRYLAGNNGDDITEHPAPFPEKLAGDHILSWSNPGDTVLDPLMGSGTTGKMAMKYGRNFIGIEIAEEYYKISERRISQAASQILLALGGL